MNDTLLLCEDADAEFNELVEEIVSSAEFKKMKKYRQHRNGTTYEHSLKVAKKCFLFCKRHNTRIDVKKLVHGALLHDYFLYNRHYENEPDYKSINGMWHLLTHPTQAWKNAKRKYPFLSRTEKDIIKRHMFPLTIVPPLTKEGWLVCFFDKIIALNDYLQPNQV